MFCMSIDSDWLFSKVVSLAECWIQFWESLVIKRRNLDVHMFNC